MSKDICVDAYCVIGEDREYNLSSDGLLRLMDTSNVSRAVIASPDKYLAVYNHDGNQAMLALSSKNDRFIPSCSVNPWYGSAGMDELKNAVESGARMAIFHPMVQGFLASDELVFPFLEYIQEAKIPVYFHTGIPLLSSPWQIAFLAERYPGIDFIMGHCGSTDYWNDVILAVKSVPNLYLESSLARPFNFARYVREVGFDKGIAGSYTPLNDMALEWNELRRELPNDAERFVFGGNLLRLLTKREDI